MTAEATNIALRYLQRRALLLSLIPLGVLFALTVTLARTYHAREEGLVREWFQKGNQDLSAGHPGTAFEDFRNALSYGPDNDRVQLRLAEALLADGRLPEARAYLVNLWERSPGSGEVNLDLAHASSRMEDREQAMRYYRAAIYGSWDQDNVLRRRNVRLELCEFLLSGGQLSEAQPEIAALSSDISPDDAILHEQAGQLFLKAGQPGKALVEFEAALQVDSRQSKWLEDAGKAAFDAGDYGKVETYLVRADQENPSGENQELLQLARDVLSGDPFRAGLSDEERAQRSWRAYQQGLERLQRCAGNSTTPKSSEQTSSDMQGLIENAQDLKKRVSLRTLGSDSELRGATMQFVFQVEETTSHVCGTPTGMDHALILIQGRHAGNNP